MTRFAIVLSVLGLSLCAASTAQADRSEFFGIAQGPLGVQDAQGMADVGVRTERFMLKWRSVEPTRGSYDWRARDWAVGELASRGIRPVPFVWGSPRWVGSGALARPPIDSSADEQAWRDFLTAAVARYGPGGSYWANKYHRQFGANATPLPIQAWQIWNEANLKRYFAPSPSSRQYAELLRISHDAIKSTDPQAQIVLAGLFSEGEVRAWQFLDNLYGVAGAKGYFDVAALHPYGCDLDQTRDGIVKFRAAMTSHRDGATPLWLTEFAWGSGAPDKFCKNKGLTGQRDLLSSSFKMILNNRKTWNVQRLFWFLWRDPASGSDYAKLCSICGTAGLLRNDRTPKAAYYAFKGLSAETTPPVASIISGPQEGSLAEDPTPTFSFASNEAGSTFECRFDSSPFTACSSPYTRPLPDGSHSFFVRAIDAPGNESAVVSRSFTVEARPPAVTISSGPATGSTSSERSPSFSFVSDEPASFSCQLDGGGFEDCSPPFTASELDDGPHVFEVRATDRVGKQSSIVSRAWTVDSTIDISITAGPAPGSAITDATPSFAFTSTDSGASFECRIEGDPFVACSSTFTPSTLPDGEHTFTVQAMDAARNIALASRQFTVDTTAPTVSVSSGPANGATTNDPTPSFQFTSTEARSSFQCRYEGEGFSACSGKGSDSVASPLSDGSHLFGVRAIDAAGNTGEALYRRFTVDTVAPKLRIEGPSKVKADEAKASAIFTLWASEQVERRCRIDSRPFRSCSWRFRTPKLLRGTHTLKVKAVDRAGNVGTERKRFKIVRK